MSDHILTTLGVQKPQITVTICEYLQANKTKKTRMNTELSAFMRVFVMVRVVIQHFLKTIVVQFVFEVIG